MKKTITLTVQQAKELYEKDNSFRTTILSEFTDSELGIKKELKGWSELGDSLKGYFIGENSHIKEVNCLINLFHRNVFATKKQAQSALAMAQLSQLMADLGDECDVDWGDGNEKHTIVREYDCLVCSFEHECYQFLTFKTESVRDAFLEKHEELIKQYFMI